MNIVYALSGEGRGHSSLAKAILPVLEGAGHQVKLITYGRSVPRLRGRDLIEIRGIRHFYSPKGRLSVLRSLAGNLGVFSYYRSHWRILRRELGEFSPDVFIVNFEPFMPLLARSLGVPVISFDNQHALVFGAQRVPPGYWLSSLVTKTAARVVASGAEAYVVMSFAAPSAARRGVHIVPPVVQEEFRRLQPVRGRDVLVYLKEPNAALLDVLRRIDRHFLVYGYDVDRGEGNLSFRSFGDDMPAEMARCSAVVGTSGLSLISEAIWLKKPFYGVPLKGEFEQTANALFIRESGLGDFSERPTRQSVESFFANLGRHEKALAGFSFDPDAAGRTLLRLAAELSRRRRRGESDGLTPKTRPQIA